MNSTVIAFAVPGLIAVAALVVLAVVLLRKHGREKQAREALEAKRAAMSDGSPIFPQGGFQWQAPPTRAPEPDRAAEPTRIAGELPAASQHAAAENSGSIQEPRLEPASARDSDLSRLFARTGQQDAAPAPAPDHVQTPAPAQTAHHTEASPSETVHADDVPSSEPDAGSAGDATQATATATVGAIDQEALDAQVRSVLSQLATSGIPIVADQNRRRGRHSDPAAPAQAEEIPEELVEAVRTVAAAVTANVAGTATAEDPVQPVVESNGAGSNGTGAQSQHASTTTDGQEQKQRKGVTVGGAFIPAADEPDDGALPAEYQRRIDEIERTYAAQYGELESGALRALEDAINSSETHIDQLTTKLAEESRKRRELEGKLALSERTINDLRSQLGQQPEEAAE